MKILISAVAITAVTLSAAPAFAQSGKRSTVRTPTPQGQSVRQGEMVMSGERCITEQEVVDAQTAWGEGIVNIGRVYTQRGDYKKAAADHINRFYGYDLSLVLFKPTLASVEQFRSSFDSALSYFVGGNETFPEDKGFAIKPFTKVRWKNAGITNNSCNMAVAMGNYFFTPADGSADIKVEYTLGYVRDAKGQLRIVVHQSSMPYSGA